MNWMTFTDDSKEQLKIVEGRLFQSCEVSYEAKYVPVSEKYLFLWSGVSFSGQIQKRRSVHGDSEAQRS